jgi:5,10-methylenetetrahydromethanopterin reductase
MVVEAPLLSCGFPPSRDVTEHARQAEALGYRRVWLYDSPALYSDIWVALARVADAAPGIGLGTAVAVPSLRHVMVTASAIATIEELAPGRLVCAFGTGFTARNAMGKRAMRWADLGEYVTALRGLLHGDVVEVDGAACQMLHSPGYAPPRPIAVPLLVAPMGPKGFAVARDVGDGVVVMGRPPDGPWTTCVQLASGTVLDPGEDHTTPRVRAAVGPWFVTGVHATWEWDRDALPSRPAGREWLAAVEAERPPGERHLAVHEGHVVTVTARDQALLDEAGPAILKTGWTGTRDEIAAHLRRAADAGVTEVVYTPAGPDIARELASFASASDAAGAGAGG